MAPRMKDRDCPAERRQQQESVAGQHALLRPIKCQRIQQYGDTAESSEKTEAKSVSPPA